MHFSSLSLAAAAIPLVLGAPAPPNAIPQGVTVSNADIAAANIVPNSYFIMYKEDVTDADVKKHGAAIKAKTGKDAKTLFTIPGFKGVHVQTDAASVSDLGKQSFVTHVELDAKVSLNPSVNASRVQPQGALAIANFLVQQPSATWGLGRISHRLKGYYNYIFDTSACANTRTYIIDTGIRTTHSEFGGRAVWGANFVAGSPNTDQHGHGTHCAGTAVGASVGVCKKGTVVAVKVLNAQGQGYTSDIMSGIQWAYYDAFSRGMSKRSVISMSLGGSYSATENALVNAVVTNGIPVVVAAGNSNANAALYSPASAANALTVGASDFYDNRASFSNFGAGLDIFAPGVSILSAYNTCDTCYWYYDGTSQATPHVAGLVNYLIAKEGLVGPTAIRNRLNALATTGKIVGTNGSPNRLAYNGDGY